MKKIILIASWLFYFILFNNQPLAAQFNESIQGKWDLVIEKDGKQLPSWLEIYKSGRRTLVGRFVYAFGSARPIAEVRTTSDKFSFSIPPQWEGGKMDMSFEGTIIDQGLAGTMQYTDGKTYSKKSWRMAAV